MTFSPSILSEVSFPDEIWFRFDRFLYQVSRAAFYLFVNSSKIFADNAKANHQQAPDNELQENDRSETADSTAHQLQI